MRIPDLETRGWDDEALGKRETTSGPNKTLVLVSIIVIAVFIILIITYLLARKLRDSPSQATRNRGSQNKLPSLFKPSTWGQRPRRNDYANVEGNELDQNGNPRASSSREMTASGTDTERQSVGGTGVDRNTSVRSVMTLPAYSPAARENERVLAREGERAGMDSVIEFPETAEDEEARREGEMESLYQIRLARRVEAQQREERRQARRDARARGDTEALADIRRRAEAAAEESLSQMLIAEHQGANRDRRVSSVQYGDLGVARHDGTRLRANSTESDHRPLLDSAASISGLSGRSRAPSNNTLNTTHQRTPSAASVLSVSSRASDDFDFPEAVHTRSNDDFEVVSLSHPHSRSTSRVATPIPGPSIEIPREEAPAYEDPPTYESPVNTRAPQLSSLERLPSIQVTTETTPVDSRPPEPNPFR